MSLPFDISPKLERILDKLGKKDRELALAVRKKIQQIIETDPSSIDERFKNLRHGMSHLKRVQVGSFILFFRLEKDIVIFEDFSHHDDAYKR